MANELQGEDGIYDWAPGHDHPDTRAREEEWRREQDEEVLPGKESLEQITERLRAGIRPAYGDSQEIEQRRTIRAALDQLGIALTQVTPVHGGIGHNRPPPDEDSSQAVVVAEVREAGEVIGQELAKKEPNALDVAQAASRLKVALGWFAKKIDAAADSFAKGFGKTLGVATAGAAIAGAASLNPSVSRLIGQIVQQVIHWLSYVTTVF